MDLLLPQISISPPPPENPFLEPYSPFDALSPPSQFDHDTFRPVHLTPPPGITTFNRRPLSPLRPLESLVPPSTGLERERFEALLQASRERNSHVSARKTIDLRKEITLKAHKTKQDERRAHFLSKVLVPPSPTATLTPKTPPFSPAVFHYSLSSPGLVSPLAFFESLSEDGTGPCSYGREPWIEQVDFRSAKHDNGQELSPCHPARSLTRPLPSLDQISARLSAQGHVRPRIESRPTRLPRFLAAPARESFVVPDSQMPFSPAFNQVPDPVVVDAPRVSIASRSLVMSPLKPSASTCLPVNPRERRALDMLSTIRRRTQSTFGDTFAIVHTDGVDSRKLKWKRYSAPADLMPLQQRTGFEHPILALPGAF